MPRAERFITTVAHSGTLTTILVPFDPNMPWGEKQRHHIMGSIKGCPIRGALAADGSQFYLPLGAARLRGTGVEAGMRVEVILAPDGPQPESLAADVRAALDAEPDARTFFPSLATFYRTTYLRWIKGAKRPETRRARVAEMIELLKAGRKPR